MSVTHGKVIVVDYFPVRIVNSSSWWSLWIPFLGSLAVALVALTIGIKANRTNRVAIERADKREHERWRMDAVAKAAASILECSQDARSVADELVLTYRRAMRRKEELPKSPDRFDYQKQSEKLRNACSTLTFSAGPGANDATLGLMGSHRFVLSAIHALESMIANQYSGWTAEDGSTDPAALLQSSLNGISTHCEGVTASEGLFASAIRRDLGISEPTTNVTHRTWMSEDARLNSPPEPTQ
ncbi:hypothetical protein [Rhodococcus sp. IEGM 1406]|uniref:hypothetical protein n=1 Tax=Rhodococcus sp. IEGM 1406 TaxID=3047083 RepID=UPI0024B7AE2C|nr:hypothetical protein [Rhodococcus sp. IEGM 1406]